MLGNENIILNLDPFKFDESINQLPVYAFNKTEVTMLSDSYTIIDHIHSTVEV